jgi:hypothetical protein
MVRIILLSRRMTSGLLIVLLWGYERAPTMLSLVPHKRFTFAKAWIMSACYSIRHGRECNFAALCLLLINIA